MEPRIRIIKVIGAVFTKATIVSSLGRKPVNGGIPPMDRRRSGSESARIL
jgi:hypothetical protein